LVGAIGEHLSALVSMRAETVERWVPAMWGLPSACACKPTGFGGHPDIGTG